MISQLFATLVAGNLGKTDTTELLTDASSGTKTPTALLLAAVHFAVDEVNRAVYRGRAEQRFYRPMFMRLEDLELDETMSQAVRTSLARLVALYIQRQRLMSGTLIYKIHMPLYSAQDINVLLYRFRSLTRGPAGTLDFGAAPEERPYIDRVTEGFRLAGALW